MAISTDTLKKLASSGANLDVGHGYSSGTLKDVVRAVVAKGAHITVDGSALSSDTVKALAQLGGKNITIRAYKKS